jgi:hypothetical protein
MSNFTSAAPLPSIVYDNLPTLLRESTGLFDDPVEKDVFLLGSLGVLSGCLPNVEGNYFEEPVSPHLYLFITAPAGSGKGKMKWSRYFGQTIHQHLISLTKTNRARYLLQMEHYLNLSRKERQEESRPVNPLRRMLFIPANSSASAFIQALADNNFKGIVFETEADTLAHTFKQEWGNFSDVLRKAFHHESTSLFRRKDDEFIEIEDPHLAIVLSGTPRQVHNMMPDVENGLFSRFLYYSFRDEGEFRNPFLPQKVDYINYFRREGKRVFNFYQKLLFLKKAIPFSLTREQGLLLTEEFSKKLKNSKLLLGDDFDANTKRLGLITFRLAMILSTLHVLEDGKLPAEILCNDLDFSTALAISSALEKHAVAVYQSFPGNTLTSTRQKFFDALPECFTRKMYLRTADRLEIQERYADKLIELMKGKVLHYENHQYHKNLSTNTH